MDDKMEKYVDKEAGLARIRGNTAIYKKMLQMFMVSGEFAKLEEQLAAGQWQQASEVAHAIKGMTGNLDFPALFAGSTALMMQLREGEPDAATLAEYRDALEKTRAYVQQMIEEA